VVSALLLGAIAGAPLVGRVADRLGRKTLGLVALIFAGIATAALANGYAMVLIGRVIVGRGVGGMSALVPTYLSEARLGRLAVVY
jgi:SP family galactose:H+ symporter-like MFS transporter